MRSALFFLVIVFLLLSVISCRDIGEKVYYAESIIEDDPEAALSVLTSIKNPRKSLSRKGYAMYAFLATQALSKCGVDLSTDTLMMDAIDYYRTSKDSARAAKAYFYGARVAGESQNSPQAVEYYLRAKDLLTGSRDHKMQFTVRYYLGELYSSQWLYLEQLEVNREAVHYAELYGDSAYLALAFHDLGIAFLAFENQDSALVYQEKALLLAEEYSTSLLSNIYYQLWLIHCDLKDYSTATTYADRLYEISPDDPFTHSVLGKNFFHNNQMDSALYYLNLSLHTEELYIRTGTYYILANLFKKNDDYALANHYLQQYIQTHDSIEKQMRVTAVLEAKNLNKQNRLAEENLLLRESDFKKSRAIFYLIILIIVLLVSTVIFYMWYHQRKLNHQREKEESFQRQEKEKLLYDKKQLQLREEYYKILNTELIPQFKSDKVRLLEDDWEIIYRNADYLFDNFTERLKAKHPKATVHDIRLCCLIKMGLETKAIAWILGIEERSVMKRKYRLGSEKIGISNGTSLEDYIRYF